VRTAARGSGAWLTDVHLTIRDADDHKVFDRQMDGPFLLIDLPPGRYDVVGVHDGEVTRQAVTIPEHGHRESMLYFPVEGEVAPHHNGED
jgi:hypothetical protein